MTRESRWVASWEVRAQVHITEPIAGFLGSCPPGFPLELENVAVCTVRPVLQHRYHHAWPVAVSWHA